MTRKEKKTYKILFFVFIIAGLFVYKIKKPKKVKQEKASNKTLYIIKTNTDLEKNQSINTNLVRTEFLEQKAPTNAILLKSPEQLESIVNLTTNQKIKKDTILLKHYLNMNDLDEKVQSKISDKMVAFTVNVTNNFAAQQIKNGDRVDILFTDKTQKPSFSYIILKNILIIKKRTPITKKKTAPKIINLIIESSPEAAIKLSNMQHLGEFSIIITKYDSNQKTLDNKYNMPHTITHINGNHVETKTVIRP